MNSANIRPIYTQYVHMCVLVFLMCGTDTRPSLLSVGGLVQQKVGMVDFTWGQICWVGVAARQGGSQSSLHVI